MKLVNWSRRRLARTDPGIGAAGPIFWALAAWAFGGSLYARTLNDGEYAAAILFAIAGLLGFGTSPLWMIRASARSHHKRQRVLREQAESLQPHLEAAFVEKRMEKADFATLDERLRDIRHGRSEAGLAATTGHYLKGTAWFLGAAAVIVAIGALRGWAALDRWRRQGADGVDGIMATTASTGTIIVVALLTAAILFGIGSVAARAGAHQLAQQDESFMDDMRLKVLDLRRN